MTEQTTILITTVIGAVIGPILLSFVNYYVQQQSKKRTKKERRPITPSKPIPSPHTWQVLGSGIILGAVIGLTIGLVFPVRSQAPKPTLPLGVSLIQEEVVNVSANQYWYDTSIQVQKGDWLEFTANGSWWSGISASGPDGDKGFIFGLGRPACGGCPVANGNLGELVGKVGNGIPFRIGISTIREISQDGNLMLSMNENTGPCKDGRSGSCYDDNDGFLEVKVTVYR